MIIQTYQQMERKERENESVGGSWSHPKKKMKAGDDPYIGDVDSINNVLPHLLSLFFAHIAHAVSCRILMSTTVQSKWEVLYLSHQQLNLGNKDHISDERIRSIFFVVAFVRRFCAVRSMKGKRVGSIRWKEYNSLPAGDSGTDQT